MFNLPEISESFSEVVFDELIRETDQLPVAYGKTFEEFYGIEEEILEEAPEPKAEIIEAYVLVIPKQKFEMPWPHRISLSKVEEMIRPLDLSEWGYMSEHWQGKSKYYLTLKHPVGGANHYRVSETTYEIIRDRYDRARGW